MEEQKLKEIIDQLDALRDELNSYRRIPADRMAKIMQKLRLEWNFNSNSMEGNTLTKGETQKLIYYGITAKGKPLRDHIEMQGHDKALKKLEAIVHKDLRLTETLIKDFHKMILAESTSLSEKNVEINPGEWKKHPNLLYTPTGEKVYFAPPDEVPALMSDLINWTNNHLYQEDLNRHKKKKYDLHPLVVACIFHKRFIAIHPFGDGNGRMGRILMNLILMQHGFMPAIVPLKSRDAYYLALNDSTAEDMSPLIEYIGQNLIQSMTLAIEGAKGNPVEEPEDWEKELSVLQLKLENKDKGIQKSQEVLRELYAKGLYDFLQSFNQKMQNFNPFFHDNTKAKMDLKIKELGTKIDAWGKEKGAASGVFFDDIVLDFKWGVLKYQGYEDFYLSTLLRLEFQSTYYNIHYMDPFHKQVKKYYMELPSKEEQTQIINSVAKALKQKIEDYTQNIQE